MFKEGKHKRVSFGTGGWLADQESKRKRAVQEVCKGKER